MKIRRVGKIFHRSAAWARRVNDFAHAPPPFPPPQAGEGWGGGGAPLPTQLLAEEVIE